MMNTTYRKPITQCLSFRHLLVLFFVTALFAIVGTGTGLSAAEISQERFDEANRLYEEGKYADALTIYREMETRGSNWKLYYNMGNCYYKSDLLVEAKIYYLKAQRLEPFEDSIVKNINIVNQRLNDKVPAVKSDFLTRLMLKLESFITLNMLSILLLLLVVVFNGFLFLLIRKGKERWLIYGVSFSLALTLLLGAYHIYRVGKDNQRSVAVITVEDARLRSGPGESNTVLFKVNPGLKVKVIGSSSSGQWLQVSASSDIAGWIEAENLQRI